MKDINDLESALLLPFKDQPEETETGEQEDTSKSETALNELFGDDTGGEENVQLDKKLSLKIISLARTLDILQAKLLRLVSVNTQYLPKVEQLSKMRSDYAFFLDNLEFYEEKQIKKIINYFEKVIEDFIKQL